MYAFFQELFNTGIYKRNQGRIARQATAGVIVVVVLAGVFRMSQILPGEWSMPFGWEPIQIGAGVGYGIPSVLLFIGLWVAYRIVNVPIFADFLVAVEAEMNKVSWPTQAELFRGAIVVLVTIFALATVLFFFDFVWKLIFTWFGVLPEAG